MTGDDLQDEERKPLLMSTEKSINVQPEEAAWTSSTDNDDTSLLGPRQGTASPVGRERAFGGAGSGSCREVMREAALETEETLDFVTYGRRLPLRRMWLFVGLAAYAYLVFSQLSSLLDTTIRSELNGLFDEMGWNVTWPDNGNGTTIFDQAFSVYKEASWVSWYLLVAGFGLLCASLGTSLLCRTRRGLGASRWITYMSLIVLFCGVLGPAMPNYLAVTDITQLVPSCAPEFDNAVRKVSRTAALSAQVDEVEEKQH